MDIAISCLRADMLVNNNNYPAQTLLKTIFLFPDAASCSVGDTSRWRGVLLLKTSAVLHHWLVWFPPCQNRQTIPERLVGWTGILDGCPS